MRVLVAGGAGYIGSHTTISLIERGHEAVVLDDFSNSSPVVIDRIAQITGHRPAVVEADLRDPDAVELAFRTHAPDAVIHFAGLKAVGESVAQPLRYYRHNLTSTFVLLDAMQRHDVRILVFSSSATVYGEQQPTPYREDGGFLDATSPYGQTKVMIERVLTDIAAADPSWNIGLLRYFNPIGAHASGRIGEDPHGIPNNLAPYISQVAVGRLPHLQVFGDDYPTADGTGERDYIHVVDLADGHVTALEKLREGIGLRAWNLGTGTPTSVLQIVRAFEKAVGKPIPYVIAPRREGDIAAFWADTTRTAAELAWTPTRTIEDMAADSWRWQSANPQGYRS